MATDWNNTSDEENDTEEKAQGVCAQCSCFVDWEELEEDESGMCRACRAGRK